MSVTNISKIQSESNSQLNGWVETILQSVTNISKIQSESNSQQQELEDQQDLSVTNISKIQSESNSQLLADVRLIVVECDQYFKDTI